MLRNQSLEDLKSLVEDSNLFQKLGDRVSEIIIGGNPKSRLLSEISQVRKNAGLSTMGGLFDGMAEEHNSLVCQGLPPHHNFESRAAKYGLSSSGEIWYSTSSPITFFPSFEAEAVDAWMNSPLHKSIMLRNYSKVGVDVMTCNGTQHFTAVFGS